MTNKETIEKNIELTFEFIKQAIEKPDILDEVSDKAEIEFLQKELLSKKSNGKKYGPQYFKVVHRFEAVTR